MSFYGAADTSILGEYNYAQRQFSGWEFSIESENEGCKKPIMNMH